MKQKYLVYRIVLYEVIKTNIKLKVHQFVSYESYITDTFSLFIRVIGNVVNGTIGKQMVDTLVESASNVEVCT